MELGVELLAKGKQKRLFKELIYFDSLFFTLCKCLAAEVLAAQKESCVAGFLKSLSEGVVNAVAERAVSAATALQAASYPLSTAQ